MNNAVIGVYRTLEVVQEAILSSSLRTPLSRPSAAPSCRRHMDASVQMFDAHESPSKCIHLRHRYENFIERKDYEFTPRYNVCVKKQFNQCNPLEVVMDILGKQKSRRTSSENRREQETNFWVWRAPIILQRGATGKYPWILHYRGCKRVISQKKAEKHTKRDCYESCWGEANKVLQS